MVPDKRSEHDGSEDDMGLPVATGEQGPATLFETWLDDLHRLAAYFMRRQPPNHTLQTTALVAESYCRLAGNPKGRWKSHEHFIASAAKAMWHILVDSARSRRCRKRAPPGSRVDLDSVVAVFDEHDVDLEALHDALNELESLGSKTAKAAAIVRLKLFGLTHVQISAALSIPLRTVERHWDRAQDWLRGRLK